MATEGSKVRQGGRGEVCSFLPFFLPDADARRGLNASAGERRAKSPAPASATTKERRVGASSRPKWLPGGPRKCQGPRGATSGSGFRVQGF